MDIDTGDILLGFIICWLLVGFIKFGGALLVPIFIFAVVVGAISFVRNL